jgi:hypothetical protein
MMRFDTFKLEDAQTISRNAIDETEHSMDAQQIHTLSSTGPCASLYIEKELVGVIGISQGWVWAVFSKAVRSHKLSLLRGLKTMLPIIAETCELKNLRTYSRKGFDVSQRLLRHMGFEQTDETETDYVFEMRL